MRLLPVTACLLIAGCGGRAAAPPATVAVTRAERVEGSRAKPRTEPAPRKEAPVRLAKDEVTEEDLGTTPPQPEAPDETNRDLKHIIRRGQTLHSLARMYGVDVKELMRVNGIVDPRKVQAGRAILIPGGATPPSPSPAPPPAAPGDEESRPKGRKKAAGRGTQGAGAGPAAREAPEARDAHGIRLAWPLHGAITAAYGRRGKSSHHSGLDIDGDRGDPILAAASGEVVEAGTDAEYGHMVIIDHGNGLITLYAHASKLLVKTGDKTRAGEQIAEVGGSGNARGTHLHFEVRRDGLPVDPMPYLRSVSVQTAGTR